MNKILGAVTVLAVSTYLGFSGAIDIKKRAVIIRKIIQELSVLKSQIQNYHEPLEQTFGKLSERRALWKECAKNLEFGSESLSAIWRHAIEKENFCSEVRNVMIPLGDVLGISTADDEVYAIEKTIEELSDIGDRMEEDYRRKHGLYTRLGAAVGLFIVILLI